MLMGNKQPNFLEIILKEKKEMDEFIECDGEYVSLCGYYHIEKSRCDSYEKILSWVLHLSEKNWIDTKRLRWFVESVCAANNLKIPKGMA